MEMKKKAEVVMVPVPGHGHYASALEFSKRLIQADDRFSVTILLLHPSSTHPHRDVAEHEESLFILPQNTGEETPQSIRFIDLPPVDPPPFHLLQQSMEHWLSLLFESFTPHVKEAITRLLTISNDLPIAALILDFFCAPMVDVAKDLGIPASYIFLASGAGFLGLMLHLPTRHAQLGTEFDAQDSDPDVHVELPGFVNPVPVRVLPEGVSNKHGGYAAFVKLAQRFRDADGIIVNTFAELEPYAVESLNPPAVYAVGPVLGQAHRGSDENNKKIMEWLDAQPESSVVFLCFGSNGSFREGQVTEMAVGLERSGHRFLWALRVRGADGAPRHRDPSELAAAGVLPEGFLDRTGERGMVCGWAPQVEVLSHRAIGGFLSHCGWNSVLESLWNGVPIATWPLYAEQQLNAFRLVKELGLAVELRLDYRQERGDVVTAEEVEVAVRGLMEGESSVREKAKEMREMSRRALMEDDGSSYISLKRLAGDILNRVHASSSSSSC